MGAELTADLRKQVAAAEADLRARSELGPGAVTKDWNPDDLEWEFAPRTPADAWAMLLRHEYDTAFAAGRTGLSWSEWRDGEIAQGAVAWVLAAVFVRFAEDNDLVAGRWIAGRGEGLRLAVDAESAFYAADPRRGTADWLREAFGHLADLPATGGVLDREHSLVWSVPLGDDTCREILGYWRQTGPDGQPLRALDSSTLDTRFLGDLYQDLSELAKKKFALLQTPTFVEEFILDRTLTPALAEFGLPGLRLIDPTCGSGHFLLGAFDRLLAAWREREPGAPAGEHVRRALDSVHGVDINPFAVAIARFRLVVAALRAAGYTRLADAPDVRPAPGGRGLPARRGRPGRPVRRHRGGHLPLPQRGHPRAPRHPRSRPVPRGRGQPAVHHGQGQGPQRGVPARSTAPANGQVRAVGAVHGAVLPARDPRRRADAASWLRRADHVQLVHEARVRHEDHRGPAVGGGPARTRWTCST